MRMSHVRSTAHMRAVARRHGLIATLLLAVVLASPAAVLGSVEPAGAQSYDHTFDRWGRINSYTVSSVSAGLGMGHDSSGSYFARSGLADVEVHSSGGYTGSIFPNSGAYNHIGDVDGHGGKLYVPMQRDDIREKAFFVYDFASRSKLYELTYAVPGWDDTRNGWVGVDPTGAYLAGGGFGYDGHFPYYVNRSSGGSLTSPGSIVLSQGLSNVQGCDFVSGTQLICVQDGSGYADNHAYRVDLARPLDGAGNVYGTVTDMGQVALDFPTILGSPPAWCDSEGEKNKAETEAVDYNQATGELIIQWYPGHSCNVGISIESVYERFLPDPPPPGTPPDTSAPPTDVSYPLSRTGGSCTDPPGIVSTCWKLNGNAHIEVPNYALRGQATDYKICFDNYSLYRNVGNAHQEAHWARLRYPTLEGGTPSSPADLQGPGTGQYSGGVDVTKNVTVNSCATYSWTPTTAGTVFYPWAPSALEAEVHECLGICGAAIQHTTVGEWTSAPFWAPANVEVVVLNPPDAVDDTALVNAGQSARVAVAANDNLAAAPQGTVEVVGIVSNGTSGTCAVDGTQAVTYTHGGGAGATDSCRYRVRQTQTGATAEATIRLNINQPPVATDDTATVSEDDSVVVSVLDNDSDGNGDPLLLTDVGTPSLGTAVRSGDGISYEPGPDANYLAAGESRSVQIPYTVEDDKGGADEGMLTVTVTGLNDDPTADDDTAAVTEGASTDISVLTNDSDPDTSDVLSVSAVDTTGTLGGVTQAGDTLTYTPGAAFGYLAAGETATDTFMYTAGDGNGGTDTATVTVTVTGVNGAPTPTDDAAATDEATPVDITPLDNDGDPDTSNTLSVSAVDTTGTLGGVTQAGDTLTYTPGAAFGYLAAGETATDTFGYTASDGQGGDVTATVTVTVTGLNGAPTAVDDTASTDEDTAVDIDVLGSGGGGDSDPDTSDTLTVSSFDDSGTQGSVSRDGDTLAYDPDGAFDGMGAGQSATDTFTYAISDGNGGSDTATVTVTVNGVNDAPTAVDDASATTDDATSVVTPLGNDSDPDAGDVLTIDSVDTTGLKGTVTEAGATLTYDPTGVWNQIGSTVQLFEDESSEQTFTYDISDGNGGTDTATVTVTVTGTLSRTADTDDGGVPDWIELIMGTDPANPDDDPLDVDSDDNGIPDWVEIDTCGSAGCMSLPPSPEDCPAASGGLTLVSGSTEPGKDVTVAGDGFLPHGAVSFFVCSAPMKFGSSHAGADGAIEGGGTIPADLAEGDHLVFALGLGSDGKPRSQSLEFSVEPTATGPDAEKIEPGDGATPAPGTDDTTPAPGANGTTPAPGANGASTAPTAEVAGATQAPTEPAMLARTGRNVAGWLVMALALIALGMELLVVSRVSNMAVMQRLSRRNGRSN